MLSRFPLTTRAGRLVLSVGTLALAAACSSQSAAQTAQPEPALRLPSEPKLLAPTQGRPVFVPPGGNLTVVASIPGAADTPVFELDSGRFPVHKHVLAVPSDAAGRLARGDPLTLHLPAELPEQTYDLTLHCGDVELIGRHCVAVGRLPERLRLVHLSNMNIGDPGAPDFDWRLIQEVNLVSPALIVATGDYLDATCDDPERGWQRLSEFLSRFDAPALLACGDHDQLEFYSRYVASSPVGVIAVGGYRGVVLYDLPARSVAEDGEQIEWVERTLTAPGDDRPTFIVAHDDSPNLLRAWQRRGELKEMLRATRLGVWFAGGHRDWDGLEYRALVEAAEPMLYVRTHQSSPATRDGAEGVSHFRVVDLGGQRAWLPGVASSPGGLPPSIPVGRLRVRFDGPNDGTQTRLAFTAVNNLPFRMNGLSVRVLLRRAGAGSPWCLGARLERAVALGKYWDCRVRFHLPDKGALSVLVGTGRKPSGPDVEVRFDATPGLPLAHRTNSEGLSFLTAADAIALVHLRNRGRDPARVTPLVRLDGQTLAYAVLDEPGPAATAYRLRIPPGRTLTLQVDLSAIRVAPGRRELQVYLKGPEAWWPACFPLEVTVVQ